MTETSRTTSKRIWLCVVLAVVLVLLGTVAVVLTIRSIGQELPEATEPIPSTFAPPAENTLGPEDFVYLNGYLSCTATPSRLGVDVSHFQGEIDWKAVKEAGMSFAMIRVAGRGYGEAGGIYNDKLAQANYEGARAAGLDVGVYFFSQAISVAEARQEAQHILELTKGWDLAMPVVFDWERLEGDARSANADPRTVTDCMIAFCEEVEKAGRRPMIYFNPDHSESMFYIEEVTDYDFWLAMYTDWMTYPYEVDMWQYTNVGTVPGIKGGVDINLYFPEYS